MLLAPPLPIADLDLVLDATRNLWQEMRGERIFITGGTGFFGCWLAESFAHINRLCGLGAQATILTRDSQRFIEKCPHLTNDPAIRLLPGDVRDFDYPDGDFKYVIHAATETSGKVAADQPIEMLETILLGTRRVLEFAASHETRKLLLTSSGAVYGAQPPSITHICEDYGGAPNPLLVRSAYGEGKRAAELMCAAYGEARGVECKIARCFAFVGPHLPLDAHFAIGNFLRDGMSGGKICVNGDGTPLRSYLYAADLAIWLWTILFRAPAFEAFNVGSNHAVSILELAQSVAAVLGSTASVVVAKQPVIGQPPQQYVPSTAKAEQQLGLRCTVSLEDALRRTSAWHGSLSHGGVPKISVKA